MSSIVYKKLGNINPKYWYPIKNGGIDMYISADKSCYMMIFPDFNNPNSDYRVYIMGNSFHDIMKSWEKNFGLPFINDNTHKRKKAMSKK